MRSRHDFDIVVQQIADEMKKPGGQQMALDYGDQFASSLLALELPQRVANLGASLITVAAQSGAREFSVVVDSDKESDEYKAVDDYEYFVEAAGAHKYARRILHLRKRTMGTGEG